MKRARQGGKSLWGRACRTWAGRIGFVLVGLLVLIGLFAPLMANDLPIYYGKDGTHQWPAVADWLEGVPVVRNYVALRPPFSTIQYRADRLDTAGASVVWPLIRHDFDDGGLQFADLPPSSAHWFGTDRDGRDVASRLVHGAAVSLKVAFGAMAISAIVGIALGLLAGYVGGWLDLWISRFIEMVVCFPAFFLLLLLMALVGVNMTNLIIVLGLTRWTNIARYVRGEAIRLREADFVAAARASGCKPARVMWRHVLPSAVTPAMVTISFGLAGTVLIESGLSWLGFGAGGASWGSLLRDGFDALRTAPHLIYPPCVAIFVSVLAYQLVGEAFRSALDPKQTEDRP
jgi:peptide/nickel transport system permease protein